MSRTLRPLLFYLFLFSSGCVSFQSPPPANAPEWNDLVAGSRFYEEGRYDSAIAHFRRIVENYPGSPLLSEAQWLLAKSYYAAQYRDDSVRELRDFLRNYPKSAHEEEAQALMILLERSDQRRVVFRWRPGSGASFQEELRAHQIRGVNTLLIQVFENSPGRRGLYFRSAGAPLIADRLGEWIESAHRAGLRLIVEAPLREMTWVTESRPELRDQRYSRRLGKLQPTDRVDLFNPEVRAMVARLYRDLARYPLDGIYIRNIYYGKEEGWSADAVRLYRELFSETPDPALLLTAPDFVSSGYPGAASFWRWVGWRSRSMRDLVEEIRREGRSEHPDLEWGIGLPAALTLDPLKGLAEFSGDLLELKQVHFDFYLLVPESAVSLNVISERLSRDMIPLEKIWIEAPGLAQRAPAELGGQTYISLPPLPLAASK